MRRTGRMVCLSLMALGLAAVGVADRAGQGMGSASLAFRLLLVSREAAKDTPRQTEQQSSRNQQLTPRGPRRCWRCEPSLLTLKSNGPR